MLATRTPILFLFNDASQIFIVGLFGFLDACYQLRHGTSFAWRREGTLVVHTTVRVVSSLRLQIYGKDVYSSNEQTRTNE
jgi:hypothetical protein